MRLLGRVADGHERLAVLDAGGHAIDVAELMGDGTWTMARLLASLDESLGAICARLDAGHHVNRRDTATLRLLPPVVHPGKIIAVGRNYREHAAEGTGTPGGVGVFRDPPRFLDDGDEVAVEIDGIGRLTNTCRILDETTL